MTYPDFSILRLTRDQQADEIEFDSAALHAVDEAESGLSYDIPVEPPLPGEIRTMRMAHGLTQPQAAALAGVAVQTWKSYESAVMQARHRRPTPATWGVFLLAIGEHPVGNFVKK